MNKYESLIQTLSYIDNPIYVKCHDGEIIELMAQAADALTELCDKVIELTAERDRARLDCAVAERNHMNTLERFLEAQELIDELKAENISLRAERDALLKSFAVTSQPIEVIQPKGVVE